MACASDPATFSSGPDTKIFTIRPAKSVCPHILETFIPADCMTYASPEQRLDASASPAVDSSAIDSPANRRNLSIRARGSAIIRAGMMDDTMETFFAVSSARVDAASATSLAWPAFPSASLAFASAIDESESACFAFLSASSALSPIRLFGQGR